MSLTGLFEYFKVSIISIKSNEISVTEWNIANQTSKLPGTVYSTSE